MGCFNATDSDNNKNYSLVGSASLHPPKSSTEILWKSGQKPIFISHIQVKSTDSMIEKKNKISDFVLSMVIEWRSVVFEVYHFVLTINGDGKQVAFGL